MPDFSFLFDGIGSSVIGAVIGALISSPIAYKFGKNSVKQKQKAGDNVVQVQIGTKNDR